ncbi:MAG: flagellar filament capping protein FliD, partial [Lachnospiraceae bacterium]|nr:flagellar filament capping protein FliD [Lachnospiraceae bacterium]
MSDRMRVTGMYSGMDTESIVQQLVAAKQVKVDNLKNDQKKLEWKQTAWQDLNTKIYNLYSGTLSKLRMSSAFKAKKTTVSDTTKATITAGSGAVNGTQTLKVKEIAKSGNLTGGKLDPNAKYTGKTKIAGVSEDLIGQSISVTARVTLNKGDKYQNAAGETITAEGGEEIDKTTNIKITEEMTINDFVGELKAAGVNASFDETHQRFFISSKASGTENDFKINNLPTSDSDGAPMGNALALLGLDTSVAMADGSKAIKVDAQDAKIELNGAEFTSSSNNFEINGLTINVLSKTADDEEITINTDTDVDGTYNIIKDFLTEYNELINEMDKLYNADSARKYSMLSADDKEAMTDEEVETWENTIKGALLRKDTQLGSVMNALTNTMLGGVQVNGQTMYLSNFGIKTLGYFKSKDNEHHAYYIDGDPDDENVSGEEDLLKKALREDPDGTADFFAGMCKNLYGALDDLMGTTDYSSIYKV